MNLGDGFVDGENLNRKILTLIRWRLYDVRHETGAVQRSQN
jgi:hypothetical protein